MMIVVNTSITLWILIISLIIGSFALGIYIGGRNP
jgi:hypothetical protein